MRGVSWEHEEEEDMERVVGCRVGVVEEVGCGMSVNLSLD